MPAAKAELVHAIYERIVVAGRQIASVRLTPAAYAQGLALAMPDTSAMARPTLFVVAAFGCLGLRLVVPE